MRVVLAFLLLCLSVSPAVADDSIFLEGGRSISEAQKLEDALAFGAEGGPEHMSAAALAEYYYKECQIAPQGYIPQNVHDLFCACAAGQMQKDMSLEQIRTLFRDTAQGAEARLAFRRDIYAPCMAEPTRALVYQACVDNDYITENLRQSRAVCACIADDLEEFTRTNAMAMFGDWQNKEKSYSIATLIGSTMFSRESNHSMTYCVREHEYGW